MEETTRRTARWGMRKIVFRIKDIDIWYYGFPLRKVRPEDLYIPFQGEDENGNSFYSISVDVKTLGQFTGLCDKNGKEIYEGDIVKTKYIEKRDFQGVKYNNEMEFVELVVFKDQAFQLEINNGGIKMYRLLNLGKDARTYGDIELKEIEVIGNIYDNPELLKGE